MDNTGDVNQGKKLIGSSRWSRWRHIGDKSDTDLIELMPPNFSTTNDCSVIFITNEPAANSLNADDGPVFCVVIFLFYNLFHCIFIQNVCFT